jgi:preprotein translocase subunit YajC
MTRNKSLILLVTVLLISMVVIGGCLPAGDEQPESTNGEFPWLTIVFLVLIFALFYFLMIRPQRKRQKEHQELVGQLQKGDRVVTAGGIYGVIEGISEDSVVIKVESGATMRVARGSVALKRER